jgi:prepilin-type N-terminal cleavage/methylation domain-containing protein
MRRNNRSRGFSFHEVIITVAVLAILGAISVPLLVGPIRRAQAAGAGATLGGAIRDARLRAIATGWQFRVVAYDASGAVPNAFRIEGMNPAGGGVWPAAGTATTPPLSGSNQAYDTYTRMAQDFGTAQIQIPGGGPFIVTFNPRGQWAVPCVPVSCQVGVRTEAGLSTLTVSQSGAVQVLRP